LKLWVWRRGIVVVEGQEKLGKPGSTGEKMGMGDFPNCRTWGVGATTRVFEGGREGGAGGGGEGGKRESRHRGVKERGGGGVRWGGEGGERGGGPDGMR